MIDLRAPASPLANIGQVMSQQPWQSGRYYFLPNSANASTSAVQTNGLVRACPFWLPNAVTLSRVGAEVTTIGDVGSKLRLGFWADDGTGRPGTLLLDAGQIAGDSATVQEIVISLALAPGIYWVGGAVQAVTVTPPTLRTSGAQGPWLNIDAGTVIPAAGSTPAGQQMTGVTGALSNFVVSSVANGMPKFFAKVA